MTNVFNYFLPCHTILIFKLKHKFMKIKHLLITFLFFSNVFSQDDGDDLLKSLMTDKTSEPVRATFKGTRLINFQTIETSGKRSLDFRISHRFGEFNQGAQNLWGLDGGASIRLALEYSYDGRLQFGIGRTSYEKQFDGFAKYRILKQTTDNKMPISVTALQCIYYTTSQDSKYDSLRAYRFSYATQLIIARKFSEKLSLQLSPTYIHLNLVEGANSSNNHFVLGGSGRYKVSKRTAITAEYGYRFTKLQSSTPVYNTLGIGFDIETGGHVFQMHFTNSFGLTENQFLTNTQTSWENWGIRLGFNISRIFAL